MNLTDKGYLLPNGMFIKIRPIFTLNDLNALSETNKRDDRDNKVLLQLEGNLTGYDKGVDFTKAVSDYELVGFYEGMSYLDAFEDRNAGADINNYYGAEFTIGYLNYDDSFESFVQDAFGKFCKVFGESNILSGMVHPMSESYPHIHFYIYTLSNGQLSPDDFMEDGDISEQFLKSITLAFKDYHFDTTIVKNSSVKEGDLPYLDTIDTYIPESKRTKDDDKYKIYDAKKALFDNITVLEPEKQEELLDNIMYRLDTVDNTLVTLVRQNKKTMEDFFDKIRDILSEIGVTDEESVTLMLERVKSAFFGNYILDPLIKDPSISDIKVLSWDNIRVKRFGDRYTSNLTFRSKNDYLRYLRTLLERNHIVLRAENPIAPFTDTESSEDALLRVNVVSDCVSSSLSPYLHFRKVRREKYTLDELIREDMLDAKVASYLLDKVKTSSGILFTGASASGKTTLLNTMLDHISFNNSVLVIQESEELFSKVHPDMMFEHVVRGIPTTNGRLLGQVTLQDLARNGLLTDIDYFVIGEIKGGEALYFLNAAYTGHKCFATCHGKSANEALNKLADYVQYESSYDTSSCLKMLQSMEVIVFLKHFKVAEISEITGFDEEKGNLIYRPIFKRNVA